MHESGRKLINATAWLLSTKSQKNIRIDNQSSVIPYTVADTLIILHRHMMREMQKLQRFPAINKYEDTRILNRKSATNRINISPFLRKTNGTADDISYHTRMYPQGFQFYWRWPVRCTRIRNLNIRWRPRIVCWEEETVGTNNLWTSVCSLCEYKMYA